MIASKSITALGILSRAMLQFQPGELTERSAIPSALEAPVLGGIGDFAAETLDPVEKEGIGSLSFKTRWLHPHEGIGAFGHAHCHQPSRPQLSPLLGQEPAQGGDSPNVGDGDAIQRTSSCGVGTDGTTGKEERSDGRGPTKGHKV